MERDGDDEIGEGEVGVVELGDENIREGCGTRRDKSVFERVNHFASQRMLIGERHEKTIERSFPQTVKAGGATSGRSFADRAFLMFGTQERGLTGAAEKDMWMFTPEALDGEKEIERDIFQCREKSLFHFCKKNFILLVFANPPRRMWQSRLRKKSLVFLEGDCHG